MGRKTKKYYSATRAQKQADTNKFKNRKQHKLLLHPKLCKAVLGLLKDKKTTYSPDVIAALSKKKMIEGVNETICTNFSEHITNLDEVKEDTDVLGEHIVYRNGNYHPSGGRVFALRRKGKDFDKLKEEIKEDFRTIKMNGLFFREDISLIKSEITYYEKSLNLYKHKDGHVTAGGATKQKFETNVRDM